MEDAMKFFNRARCLGLALYLTAALVAVGCHHAEDKANKQAKAKIDTAKKTEKAVHEEHGWWCEEHGIPEDICGLCNVEYRNKKKAEGDWCELHARLKSQCFKCDPSLYEKEFEPQYVNKYGKKPPRPPESEFTK
jgi:hypothetical protein